MARNVIYFNSDNNGTLADIVGLPYTDVIVCFLLPNSVLSPEGDLDVHGDGAAFVDGNLQGNIRALQNAGKNVLVSFGGDPKTFPTSAWQFCAQNVRTLVNSINMFVLINGFNGVDIDYEDNAGFTGTYDGIGFLSELTSGLAHALPPGHNIVTHAPQTVYWYPGDGFGAAYQQIWQRVGNQIAWFNNQFYDNAARDATAGLKVQTYRDIAGIAGGPPLQKLLVGALLPNAGTIGTNGIISLGDMVQNVIMPLQSQFGAQFGGVMGWQFAFDQGGNWAKGVSQALAGSPVPIPRPPPPPTIDPEIVYLCNCYLSDGQKSSEMNYYPKTSLSQHGERPAATAVVAIDGTVTWEGHPVVGTFPDGNHFTSNITDHNGPVGAVKGSGFNDYHQFTCRQDSGRLLYEDGNKSCFSIYYCQ
jgi:hypothetical protein